ncbi:plasmid replication protein RepC [Oryzifoliimicrobium ureilyticus]|uniref:plasmid replication protein RepC n=1 Tax=Oryzifoliimicrobium ureilyticus TaxID=3113724 RepID=UPI00307662D5
MQGGNVTTPFGRRAMSLALFSRQQKAAELKSGKSADKWKIYRDACDARSLLGLRDRALAVLSALLSFYPDTTLREDANLVVFPSNAQLSARANGIAGTTLRENLAMLVEAGLIQRNDSPNGKRYVRKASDGSIQTAYGFSLAPLLARSEELASLAQQVAEETQRLKATKEKLTITRRDIRKLVSAAIHENVQGHWLELEERYVRIVSKLKRAKTLPDYRCILKELELLRVEVVNHLENHINSQKIDANGAESRCHIQNTDSELLNESEPGFEKELGATFIEPITGMSKPQTKVEPVKSFPLEIVLRACPEIVSYGPTGAIGNWRDLMSAAVIVRSMLGVSPAAYQEACEVMGPENAATAIAAIFERSGHINSPGGYLRDLTGKARKGEFSLGPMLMALLRARGGEPLRRAS